jgi:hydrogenase maturation protease
LTQTLIVGYGNPDREDDGVAWHILTRLAQRLSLPEPAGDAEGLAHLETSPHLLCLLQLNPELAELVAEYESICFVDAHTGAYPEAIRCETIEGEFLPSPFTHHMTPSTLLMLAQTLYGRTPRALVVSVRGYQFGFSDQLSPATAALVETAIAQIITWLHA